jgi:hypothetical protein
MRNILSIKAGIISLLVATSVTAQTNSADALREALLGINLGASVSEATQQLSGAECNSVNGETLLCESTNVIDKT